MERAEIRPLTPAELPLCEASAKAFHLERKLPGEFALEVFIKHWTFFMQNYPAQIFGLWREGALIGGLGAMIAPDINTYRLVANEFFWYVNLEERKGTGAFRLLTAFEGWGADHAVDDYRLVHMLTGEDTERFPAIYEHRGYQPIEVAYIKHRTGG